MYVHGVKPAGARSCMPEVVRSFWDVYGYTDHDRRPPRPTAADISRMEQVLSWITTIPRERAMWRRVVGMRSLINADGNHVWSWGRLAKEHKCDRMAPKYWHKQGIRLIVAALGRSAFCVRGPFAGPDVRCLDVIARTVPSLAERCEVAKVALAA